MDDIIVCWCDAESGTRAAQFVDDNVVVILRQQATMFFYRTTPFNRDHDSLHVHGKSLSFFRLCLCESRRHVF